MSAYNYVTKISQCDFHLDNLNKRLGKYRIEMAKLDRQEYAFGLKVEKLVPKLEQLNQEMAASQLMIDNLPEGGSKREMIRALKKLEIMHFYAQRSYNKIRPKYDTAVNTKAAIEPVMEQVEADIVFLEQRKQEIMNAQNQAG